MADAKYLKCLCAQCGGRIEFPAEGIGTTAPCPHCGWQTELTVYTPSDLPVRSPRNLKWMIAGVVILAIGLVGSISAVVIAKKLAQKFRDRGEATQAARSIKTNAGPESLVGSHAKRAEIINGFSVSEVRIEKTAGSSLVYASGTLRNETNKQRFDVTVEVDLFDGAGKKVAATKDYKDVIEPRGQWTFRALVVNKNVASASVASIREQP